MDTLAIDSIKVVETRGIFYSNNINITPIDSFIKDNNTSSSLSDLLLLTNNIYVHGNSTTGFSTSGSIRGAGSYQTLVNWNGFPINSPTLGTFDLSIANTSIAQEIYISKGAPSTLYGSGSFGGAIDLLNKPDWKNKLNIAYYGNAGSFSDCSNVLELQIGNHKIQSHTGFQIRNALLNFPFNENGFDEKYNFHNNRLKSNHFNQNVFIKLNHYNVEAGFWYSDKYKEIPRSSHSSDFDIQKDSIIRTYLKIQRNFINSILQINSAYLSNYQRFSSYPYIQSTQYLIDIDYRYYINNHVTLELGNINQLAKAESKYYGGGINENKYGFIFGTKITFSRIITNVFFRKEFHDHYLIKPIASLNMKYNMVNDKIFLTGSISKNYRIPTLNDRFWVNSANSELLPEEGWVYDVGTQFYKKDNRVEVELKFNIFSSFIENMIQWFPTSNIAIWSPENAKKVWSRGIDAGLINSFKIGNFKITAQADYVYSKSTNTEVYINSQNIKNKQLRYCPNHIAKTNIDFQLRKYFLFISQSYTSCRYIDEDNSELRKLPGFYLANISIGRNHSLNSFAGRLSFTVSNIFNTRYRLVNEFPVPGRAFYLNYKIQFNK